MGSSAGLDYCGNWDSSGMKEVRVSATAEQQYIIQYHRPGTLNKHPWLCKEYHNYKTVMNLNVFLFKECWADKIEDDSMYM